jgi:hypothetical protein
MNNPFQSYNRGYTARERRIRRDLGMLLAITGIISVWLAFRTTSQDRTIDRLEVTNTALRNKADSLKSELFITSTVIARYELSLDYLKESNSKAAKEFEKFYNHETE